MAASFAKWFPTGFRLINGQTLTNWFNNPQTSIDDAITAHAGGGQANAYQLSAIINRVSVCAAGADSVKLPQTSKSVGMTVTIINDGAQTLAVFPFKAATIDGGAADASVNISTGNRADFYCTTIGKWSSAGSGKAS